MTVTAIGDDDRWLQQAFSEREVNELEKTFQTVVDENMSSDTQLEIIIGIAETDVTTILKEIGPSYGCGHNIIDRLIEALAVEYDSNDQIDPDFECSRIYQDLFGLPESYL